MEGSGVGPHTGVNQSLEACPVCLALSGLHGLSSIHPLGPAFVSPGSVCITSSEVPAESFDSGAPRACRVFFGLSMASAHVPLLGG